MPAGFRRDPELIDLAADRLRRPIGDVRFAPQLDESVRRNRGKPVALFDVSSPCARSVGGTFDR
jgi:hypothetical protein